MSSAAEAGRVGCQLLVNKAMCDIQDSVVIDASYKHLFAWLSGKCRLDVCAIYAPHMGCPEQERDWWHQLRSCIARHRKRDATPWLR